MTAYAIAHRDKYIKLELNKDNYYDEPAWYEADLNDKDFYISTSKNKINELLNAIRNTKVTVYGITYDVDCNKTGDEVAIALHPL